MSKRRRREMRARREAVALRLEMCEYRCEARELVASVECNGPLHPHEPWSRGRGGPITNVDNIRMICAAHHRWTHDHPTLAELAGLLIPSWAAR